MQWVKNPTTVTQVTTEAQVRSPAQHSGLKDPMCHSRSSDSVPVLRTSICYRCGHLKKKIGGYLFRVLNVKIRLFFA